MKINLIVLILIISSFLHVGCNDKFDIEPDGSTLTANSVKKAIELDPEKLSAEINGMFGLMKAYNQGSGFSSYQGDFGWPALAVRLEHNGQDCVGDVTGYNWFSRDQDYTNRNYTYTAPRIYWRIIYKQIRAANSIIAKIDPNTDNDKLKFYLGQALATRAYDYLYLAQTYQFTYVGHENLPCVPIVLDDTPFEQLGNNPRATVKEVYDQIFKDLNTAIPLMEGGTRSDKSQIDQAIAYGIRARANLIAQKWNDAASDADKALSLSGETPMSIAQVSHPTFDDVNESGIMWGCIITDQDEVVQNGITNFTSMFTSLCFGYGGYTTIVGTWKKISILLYNKIPDTDVRKGWWLDENYEASAMEEYENSGEAEEAFLAWFGVPYDPAYGPIWGVFGMDPYTNVKFAPNNKKLTDPLNATDFPLMRAEEMVLIKAEAEAMGGNLAGGKQTLESFVKTYRDPSFVSTATSATELQDEVWLQRRIEFWGEGLSFFDLLRLNKPVIRKENGVTNFGALAIFNIPAGTPYLLWPIPLDEIQANQGISDADNNDMGTLPVSDPVKKVNIKDFTFKKKAGIGFMFNQQ